MPLFEELGDGYLTIALCTSFDASNKSMQSFFGFFTSAPESDCLLPSYIWVLFVSWHLCTQRPNGGAHAALRPS
jgi:hypothetical protein